MKKAYFTLIMVLTVASLCALGPVRQRSIDAIYQIHEIRILDQTPCSIRFSVAYYIKETRTDTCFISAYIPGRSNPSPFSFVPAGRAGAGIPHGHVEFDQNVIVEARYEGMAPLTTDKIEVVMYTAERQLATYVFSYRKTWKRFEIQGIKHLEVRPDRVLLQVQYFIDPAYAPACFLGAEIPDISSPNNTRFSYIPAGRLPAGVPKGQKHFSDKIVVEVHHRGPGAYRSAWIEMKMYNAAQDRLASSLLTLRQLWNSPVR